MKGNVYGDLPSLERVPVGGDTTTLVPLSPSGNLMLRLRIISIYPQKIRAKMGWRNRQRNSKSRIEEQTLT